jgi:hypothetical protein
MSLKGLEEGRISEIFNEALNGMIKLANAVLYCNFHSQIPQKMEGGKPVLSCELAA